MILIRLALYLTLTLPAGLASFGLLVTPGERGRGVASRPAMLASAVLAMIGSMIWLPLVAAQMAGTSAWPVELATVQLILGSTAVGTAWLIRMAALLAAIAAMARPIDGRARLTFIAASFCIALGSLAWTGHGVVGDGAAGWLHLGADILHLVASAIWIGALVRLTAMAMRRTALVDEGHLRATHDALRAFGPVGIVVVGALVVTGLINGWSLLGPDALGSLVGSDYGRLLIAKLALFGIMLALAGLNRVRFTPAFRTAISRSSPRGALRVLRFGLIVETTAAILVLGLLAWLGTLEPPVASPWPQA
ncbi:copper homeostasis membrane protein CopD [Sphingomonas bacterium]|uniref:copper homeostasis membrane protein CopD n=1 Tax=Sphingomonas bacterium TaxID=1895847 RepID=UPI001575CEDA|nr:copper homeostasis membrane protein CopD [Sphingomonas bacterium]